MKSYHQIKVYAALTILLFVTGCGINPSELKFEPFHKKEFSSRDKKASVVKNTAMDLITDGHVLIGFIDLRQNIESCFPDTGCQNIRESLKVHEDEEEYEVFSQSEKKQPSREEELQFEAAKVGGDKISMLQDVKIETGISKQICNYYNTFSYTIDGKVYTSTTCGSYRTVYGTLHSKIKRALVWRFEPSLAGSKANIDALKVALNTIDEKNIKAE